MRPMLILFLFILSCSVALAICQTEGEFDIEKCNTTEIADYCNLNNCTTEQLDGLELKKKGEVLDKVKNYNNVPYSEIVEPENRGFINITENEFIVYYNELPGEKQKKIYNNFADYKGELDEDFFSKVNTEKNIDKFWDVYDFGDITNFMKGLSTEERINAFVGYLYDESGMEGLGEFKPETLRRILARKGYNLSTLDYPNGLNFSIKNGSLMINETEIPLEVLTGVDDLIINDSIYVNGVQLEKAVVEGFNGEDFKVNSSSLINKSYFTLINSSGVQFLDNNLRMDEAEKLIIEDGNLTEIENSSVLFENKSLKKAEFKSATNNNSFSFNNFSVLMDNNDTLEVKKGKGKYNISVKDNVTVKDYGRSLNKVHLSPGSRYTYAGEGKNFSIYLPSDNNLTIYFNKTSCYNCGIIDFENNVVTLRGVFEYERINNYGLFTNIIEGEGNFTLEMDNNLDSFNVSYKGEAVFYNGGVKIKCRDYCRYGFSGLNKPYVINEVKPEIKFEQRNMHRQIAGNDIIMYDEELDEKLKEVFSWLEDR